MTAWAAQALLGSTLVMLLLLGIRANFVYFGGARAVYALWALVPLRFLLPPLPAPVLDGPVAVSFQIVAGSAAPTQASFAMPWLLASWLAGVAILAGFQLLAYRRFIRRALAGAVPLGVVDGIPVLRTPAVTGPVALGPFRRRILVPASFADQPAAERAFALRHEALHHARGDLWANLLACALLALHWFNPVAWIAHRAFRRDQELACDAAVIGEADATARHHYGRALARAAGALPPAPATTLGEASTLKRRLDMLTAHRARTGAAGRIATAALGLAALGVSATGVAQPAAKAGEEARAPQVERYVLRRGEGTDAATGARVRAESADGAVREFLRERGERIEPETLVKRECEDAERFESSARFDGGREIKVVLCQRDAGGDQSANLRRMQERIRTNDRLTAQEKVLIEQALAQAIATRQQTR